MGKVTTHSPLKFRQGTAKVTFTSSSTTATLSGVPFTKIASIKETLLSGATVDPELWYSTDQDDNGLINVPATKQITVNRVDATDSGLSVQLKLEGY